MADWNEQYPEWAYTQITNFGRDSRDALRRLEERMGYSNGDQVSQAGGSGAPDDVTSETPEGQ